MTYQIEERIVSDVTILKPLRHFGSLESPFRNRIFKLISEGRKKFVLDASEISNLDSSGLGELVGAWLSVRKVGGHLIICHPSAKFRNILSMTNLLPFFRHVDSITDVLPELEKERIFTVCPRCGEQVLLSVWQDHHTCGRCRAELEIEIAGLTERAAVSAIRLWAYPDEAVTLRPNTRPVQIDVQSRLDLFSSEFVAELSGLVPPQLGRTFILYADRERSEPGWLALVQLFQSCRTDKSAIVIKGLSADECTALSQGITVSPFVEFNATAAETLFVPIRRG